MQILIFLNTKRNFLQRFLNFCIYLGSYTLHIYTQFQLEPFFKKTILVHA